jgi:hypothetical protein
MSLSSVPKCCSKSATGRTLAPEMQALYHEAVGVPRVEKPQQSSGCADGHEARATAPLSVGRPGWSSDNHPGRREQERLAGDLEQGIMTVEAGLELLQGVGHAPCLVASLL